MCEPLLAWLAIDWESCSEDRSHEEGKRADAPCCARRVQVVACRVVAKEPPDGYRPLRHGVAGIAGHILLKTRPHLLQHQPQEVAREVASGGELSWDVGHLQGKHTLSETARAWHQHNAYGHCHDIQLRRTRVAKVT